jgi:hypothetical protein
MPKTLGLIHSRGIRPAGEEERKYKIPCFSEEQMHLDIWTLPDVTFKDTHPCIILAVGT